MGEYNRVVKCEKLSWKRDVATLKSLEVNVSSISPSSERLEEKWIVLGLYAANGATLLVGIWWWENKNKLAEWKALLDTVGIKSADLEDKILFQSFAASELPSCKERPQTAICCRMIGEITVSSDWFGCVLVISFYVAKVFSESVT